MTTDTEDDVCLSDAWILDRQSRSWSRDYSSGQSSGDHSKHPLITRCTTAVRRSSSTPMPVSVSLDLRDKIYKVNNIELTTKIM